MGLMSGRLAGAERRDSGARDEPTNPQTADLNSPGGFPRSREEEEEEEGGRRRGVKRRISDGTRKTKVTIGTRMRTLATRIDSSGTKATQRDDGTVALMTGSGTMETRIDDGTMPKRIDDGAIATRKTRIQRKAWALLVPKERPTTQTSGREPKRAGEVLTRTSTALLLPSRTPTPRAHLPAGRGPSSPPRLRGRTAGQRGGKAAQKTEATPSPPRQKRKRRRTEGSGEGPTVTRSQPRRGGTTRPRARSLRPVREKELSSPYFFLFFRLMWLVVVLKCNAADLFSNNVTFRFQMNAFKFRK